MPWKICFRIPPLNQLICINIPILVDPFRKIPPDWLTGLDDKIIKDLPSLATIDALAANLSNATLRRTLQAAVQNGVTQPALKDVNISFGKKGQ